MSFALALGMVLVEGQVLGTVVGVSFVFLLVVVGWQVLGILVGISIILLVFRLGVE